MIRVFFDTEFTDLVIDPKLISIGLVDETGERTFYAELSDTWRLNDVGDFARVTVVPQLEGGTTLVSMRELGERLTAWLEAFGEPVKLATDSLTWDWSWVQEIFFEHGAWPGNVDGKPLLLTVNYINDYDAFLHAVESGFSAGLRRHHALDDAKANRLGWIAGGGDVATNLEETEQERSDSGGLTVQRVFFDTEFTNLYFNARLISIGLASEDGSREFYAELSDTYQVAACSDFVKESVLPLLQGGEARVTLRELTRHLGLWLETFGGPVKLATDSDGWDWRWLSRIFATPSTWPRNLDSRPLLLDTTVAFQAAVQKAFADGLRSHHALDDAKANRLGWIACGGDVATILRDAGK